MRNSAGSRSVERALRISVLDGVLHALMLGVSESYFGACAFALGHTDTALALLTIPLFAGALAQAFTGPLVLWLGSRKRLVVVFAIIQTLSHVGLIAVAWFGVSSLWPLMLFVLLYFVSGMVMVPAWGAWMGALTEGIDRERYFALRSGAASTALLLAFLWGGYHLRDGQSENQVSHAYALLFSVGLLARLCSSFFLMAQLDPSPPARDSLRRVLARTRSAVRSDGFVLALGLGILLFGAHISVPFYAPYMLKTLKLGYDGFAQLCAVQLVVKALVFPCMHRVVARVGLARTLICAILLTASVAWLWGAFADPRRLFLAQVLSGIAWAAYDFSSFQLLLGATRPSYRVEFLAMAASVGGLCQLAGALLGSFFLSTLDFAYRDVFLLSSVARLLPLLVLVPLLHGRLGSEGAWLRLRPRLPRAD